MVIPPIIFLLNGTHGLAISALDSRSVTGTATHQPQLTAQLLMPVIQPSPVVVAMLARPLTREAFGGASVQPDVAISVPLRSEQGKLTLALTVCQGFSVYQEYVHLQIRFVQVLPWRSQISIGKTG